MATPTRRRTYLAPFLLVGAVLLLGSVAFAIANLAETSPLPPIVRPPDPSTGGPRVTIHPYVYLALAAIGLGAFIVGVVFYFRKLARLISPWELLFYAVAIGVLILFVVLWPEITRVIEDFAGRPGTIGPTDPTNNNGTSTGPRPLGGLSTGVGLSLAAVALLGVSVILWSLRRYAWGFRRAGWDVDSALGRRRTQELRREVAGAVDRALLDLDSAADYRTAVLACYQRMCRLLEKRGLRGQEVLTPREIETRALSQLGLSSESVDRLTGLFEEARYSHHAVGPVHREGAVRSLTAIRTELEAAA